MATPLDDLRLLFDATYDVVARLDDGLVEWRPSAGEPSTGEIVAAIAASRARHVCLLRGEPVRDPGNELPPRAGYNFVRRLAEHSALAALRRLEGIDPGAEGRLAILAAMRESELALCERLSRYIAMAEGKAQS